MLQRHQTWSSTPLPGCPNQTCWQLQIAQQRTRAFGEQDGGDREGDPSEKQRNRSQ